MSYTTNELALLDLIGNVNKIFYYVGEDGDLIDEFDVKQLDKAVASFKNSIKLYILNILYLFYNCARLDTYLVIPW